MTKTSKSQRFFWVFVSILLFFGTSLFAQREAKPLVLQEMTWTDVRDYLKKNDMAIIPLGSTEQHGPHLPLGTDYYEATEISKMISAETGVVVVPVLFVGYSAYHSGFPGSLSIKPETMEQVIFESIEFLIKYGFRRFVFFNYHGGNTIVESKVIHRINHTTEAIAVAIGSGTPIQMRREKTEEFFDAHAGVGETSTMLYLKPELVKMKRAKKPKLDFTSQMGELYLLGQKNPDLLIVWESLIAVPEETNKGGASHEISNNGIWTFSDPRTATRERGEKDVKMMVERAVKFIQDWKKAEK